MVHKTSCPRVGATKLSHERNTFKNRVRTGSTSASSDPSVSSLSTAASSARLPEKLREASLVRPEQTASATSIAGVFQDMILSCNPSSAVTHSSPPITRKMLQNLRVQPSYESKDDDQPDEIGIEFDESDILRRDYELSRV